MHKNAQLFVLVLIQGLFIALAPMRLKAQSPPNGVTISYPLHVEQGLERALHRIQQAHQTYRQQRHALANSAEHERELTETIHTIARRESRPSRILRMTRYMLYGGNRAQQELDRSIRPKLLPWMKRYSQELNNLLFTLERECAAATEELAYHLAMYPGETATGPPGSLPAPRLKTDYKASLRQLGFGSAGLGVSVGFDVLSIKASTLARTIPVKLHTLLITLFGKHSAILSTGAAAAVADGPLPIGDMIALGGVAWTVYDLHASSGRYRRVLRRNLMEGMQEARTEGHRQADSLSTQIHQAYQRAIRQLADEALK